MQGWAITLEGAGDEPVTSEHLDSILDALEAYSPAVAGGAVTDPGRFSITLSIEGDLRAGAALGRGVLVAEKAAANAGLGGVRFVRCEVMTFAEQDAELARPVFPAVVGISEIADLLEVSRQRASELQHRAGFPAPVVRLKSGPIWLRANLDAFVEGWSNRGRAGRPARVTEPGST